MDLTKMCKVASAICLVFSLTLFATMIPFDKTPRSLVRFDSLSEKEIIDEQDFQKQAAKYNKNYKEKKEYEKRKEIFVYNKEYIETINAERKKNYTMANITGYKYSGSYPVLALN